MNGDKTNIFSRMRRSIFEDFILIWRFYENGFLNSVRMNNFLKSHISCFLYDITDNA